MASNSRKLAPGGTIDLVSLVGFRFCPTKLFGYFRVPFHANFDEVNLRF